MTVMERIERMQEESLRRLHCLETTVKDNTHAIKSVADSLEFLGKQVEDVTLHVDSLQTQVETLEKENAMLRDKWITMEAYQRRNNLRVAGIPERTGENIKNIFIDIFSQISPDIAGQLHFSVDTVHRLGTSTAVSSCSSYLALIGIRSGEMREPPNCSRTERSKSLRI